MANEWILSWMHECYKLHISNLCIAILTFIILRLCINIIYNCHFHPNLSCQPFSDVTVGWRASLFSFSLKIWYKYNITYRSYRHDFDCCSPPINTISTYLRRVLSIKSDMCSLLVIRSIGQTSCKQTSLIIMYTT